METEIMGRVQTEATIENLGDLWDYQRGRRRLEELRSITVLDAAVDTGTTLVALPTRLIHRLGLCKTTSKHVASGVGPAVTNIFDPVRLTIQDRSCTMDVVEVPDSMPVIIGSIPLLSLDLVIDLNTHSLTGNPAHGGEHVNELY